MSTSAHLAGTLALGLRPEWSLLSRDPGELLPDVLFAIESAHHSGLRPPVEALWVADRLASPQHEESFFRRELQASLRALQEPSCAPLTTLYVAIALFAWARRVQHIERVDEVPFHLNDHIYQAAQAAWCANPHVPKHRLLEWTFWCLEHERLDGHWTSLTPLAFSKREDNSSRREQALIDFMFRVRDAGLPKPVCADAEGEALKCLLDSVVSPALSDGESCAEAEPLEWLLAVMRRRNARAASIVEDVAQRSPHRVVPDARRFWLEWHARHAWKALADAMLASDAGAEEIRIGAQSCSPVEVAYALLPQLATHSMTTWYSLMERRLISFQIPLCRWLPRDHREALLELIFSDDQTAQMRGIHAYCHLAPSSLLAKWKNQLPSLPAAVVDRYLYAPAAVSPKKLPVFGEPVIADMRRFDPFDEIWGL